MQSTAFLEQGNQYICTLLTTCNYFHVLGIDRPLMGRFFASASASAARERRWPYSASHCGNSQFDADPRIVGKTIHLNGVPVAVIGVAPSDAANYLLGGAFVPYTLEPQLNHAEIYLPALTRHGFRSPEGCALDPPEVMHRPN